jgi:hypothetical protein
MRCSNCFARFFQVLQFTRQLLLLELGDRADFEVPNPVADGIFISDAGETVANDMNDAINRRLAGEYLFQCELSRRGVCLTGNDLDE